MSWLLVSVARSVSARGAGLGNEVIPWAKSYIASRALGHRLMKPWWGPNRYGLAADFGWARSKLVAASADPGHACPDLHERVPMTDDALPPRSARDSIRRIAVLMTCHNRVDKTLRSLRFLRDQAGRDRDFRLDVVVVDAGSSDGTAAEIAQYFPEVNHVMADRDTYWSSGMRAAGIAAEKAGRSDFHLWLNDDVELSATAVQELLRTHAEAGGGVVVVGQTEDGAGTPTYGGLRRSGRRPLAFDLVDSDPMHRDCDTFNGNIVLIPRSVLDSVGLVDGRFVHAMGDLDYGLRARENGVAIRQAAGFLGRCARNPPDPRGTVDSIAKRFRLVRSPKRLPPAAWWHFCRRHAGILAVPYFIKPYFGAVLPRRGGGGGRPEPAGATVRVLHILASLRPSGMERMLVVGAPYFKAEGVVTEVLAVGPGPHPYRPEIEAAVEQVHLVPSAKSVSGIRALCGVIRDGKYDVVHIHTEGQFAAVSLAVRASNPRVRMVRSIHNTFRATGKWRMTRIINVWVGKILGAELVAVSAGVAEVERRVTWTRLQVIENWIDNLPDVPRDSSTKGPGAKVALIIGNCSATKAHEVVLRHQVPAGWRLVHIGDTTGCSAEEQELLGRPHIENVGMTSRIAEWLAQSGVVLLPSRDEGASLVAMEAVSMGVPVLYRKIPGLRWLADFAGCRPFDFEASCWPEVTALVEGYQRDRASASRARHRFSAERGVRQYVAVYRHGARSSA